MGVFKRYIDGASEEALDRIITQQLWLSGVQCDYQGRRCIFGVVNDAKPHSFGDRSMMEYSHSYPYTRGKSIAMRFNYAYDRWGDRFIRALKAYAAKKNRVETATCISSKEEWERASLERQIGVLSGLLGRG